MLPILTWAFFGFSSAVIVALSVGAIWFSEELSYSENEGKTT